MVERRRLLTSRRSARSSIHAPAGRSQDRGRGQSFRYDRLRHAGATYAYSERASPMAHEGCTLHCPGAAWERNEIFPDRNPIRCG